VSHIVLILFHLAFAFFRVSCAVSNAFCASSTHSHIDLALLRACFASFTSASASLILAPALINLFDSFIVLSIGMLYICLPHRCHNLPAQYNKASAPAIVPIHQMVHTANLLAYLL
jgi:hypothetical protein